MFIFLSNIPVMRIMIITLLPISSILLVSYVNKTENLGLLAVVSIMAIFAAFWLNEKLIYQKIKMLLLTAKKLGTEKGATVTEHKGILDELAQTIDNLGLGIERSQEELESAEITLREKEKKYRLLINNIREVIFQTDEAGLFTFLNPAWTEITGLEIGKTIGTNFVNYIHPEDREKHLTIWEDLPKKYNFEPTNTGLNYCYEIRYLSKKNELKWLDVECRLLISIDNTIMGFSGTIHDITDRKESEEKLEKYAFYDNLTNLPNQTLFLENIPELNIHTEENKSDLFAILFVELDRFQMVKYSLGHELADQVLIEVGRRIEVSLRSHSNYIARVGLDQFAVLLKDLTEIKQAIHIANRIYQRLIYPFELKGHQVFISANIGIALNSIKYEKPQDLIRAADTAMHHAKTNTNSHYAVFEEAMQTAAIERLQIESDLRKAIERQEFRVYYQPIISLVTGKICGFEALVRWQHPKRGFISPGQFIPIAEEAGLITLIDQWVLYRACRQVGIWQKKYPQEIPLTISVNFSARQLTPLAILSERIESILEETGLKHNSLKIEITESVIMQNADASKAILEKLKKAGILISIDDFGTGYSSLARLNQLPIDTLKVDQSFVMNMNIENLNIEIVRTIIDLAHSLKMDVVAEGIETKDQLELLRGLKCEYGQGYFMSKPVDHEQIDKLLSTDVQW